MCTICPDKMKALQYIIILCVFNWACCQDASWIDPYDMNVGENIIYPHQKAAKESHKCPQDTTATASHAFSHYKRIISLLLASVSSDNDGHYSGILKLNIDQDDYNFLKEISKATEEDPQQFRNADTICSKILTKPKHEILVEVFVTWTDSIIFTVVNKSTGILLTCVFVLYASYKLLKANFALWMVVKYLVFLSWVVDFGFTWMYLLQEEEINKLADSLRYSSIPAYCDPSKMSWWQFMWSHIATTESECRTYHKNLYQSAFWKISPFTVLSHQLGTVIMTPAGLIGQAVGNFTSAIWSSLPFGVNIFLLPLLLIFAAIMMCLLLSFGTQTAFEINIFHMLSFNFGYRERRAITDSITGRNLSRLIDTLHRNAVQDVREDAAATESNSSDAVKRDEGQIESVSGHSPTGKHEDVAPKAIEQKKTDLKEREFGTNAEKPRPKLNSSDVKSDGSGDGR